MPRELVTGDILIQLDKRGGADHSLMWVGGEKPVVHSVEGDKFNGVIQQSARYFLERWENVKPTDEWKRKVDVYRARDPNLGPAAARFATEWATRSDDQACGELATRFDAAQAEDYSGESLEHYAAAHPRQKRAAGARKNVSIGSPGFRTAAGAPDPSTNVVLDTPYSQRRLLAGGGGNQPWDTLSLFRALRAYHRGTNHLPLSQLIGVTCSQFVTYCYQAGSLSIHFGNNPIPQEVLALVSKDGQFYSLKGKGPGSADLVQQGLKGYDAAYQQAIPQEMRVDAKTTSAGNLMARLEQDMNFEWVGALVATRDKRQLKVLTPAEGKDGMTWSDVWNAVG
jgi:hypothetical protein